jgi:hypothetical protein
MKVRFLALVAVCALTSLSLSADDDHHHAMDPGEKLGAVSFPVSCAANVQKPFERGLALLYSFEYEEADKQFKDVAASDPHCAMAFWGQAMTRYHQLWGRPPKTDLKDGSDLVQQAQALQARTQRERDYIDALAVFYRDAENIDHKKRAVAYATAMEGVYQRNPKDREAGVFYALSLLGSAPQDDPTLANPRKAVAILNKLFDEHPDHPGIAHYIIHACDNPAMASLGLTAARKYASIAPSSAHAVHMPSHIFARLGLWQDDINSNRAAIEAADKMAAMHLHTAHHKMHSLDFMQYAYLQIGDDEKAKATLDELKKMSRNDIEDDYKDYYDDMLTAFSAQYAIERRQWKEALALQPVSGAVSSVQSFTYWAHAVAAGHLHDAAAASDALQHYNALLEATRKGPKPYIADSMKDEQKVVQAWANYAEGKNDEALSLLRSVADHRDKIGKGETELPAREMLADMLLELNRPQDSLAEFETSLRTDPNRFNGLYGAARASEMVNQKQKATGFYAQLLKNCQGSNSDRPELARAKTLLAVK